MSTQPAYRLKRDHFGHKAGTTVYEQKFHDYGLASADTRKTGIEHISVTLKSDGGYPGFTVPVRDLEALPAVPACQGANCGTTDGVSHSPECVAEAAKVQGWSDAPEAEIQAKGPTAPSVTPADIEAAIASEHYFTGADAAMAGDSVVLDRSHPMHNLTFCVLVLRNGHTVTGESYCADPAKFNAETGRVEARKVAINELWPMAIYAERERLAAASTPHPVAAIARQFIDDNRVSCPEATTNDRVYENAPELVEQLADVVGYFKHPEDEV